MAGATDWITTKQTGDVTEVFLSGRWSLQDAGKIDDFVSKLSLASSRAAILDVGAIEDLDTAGAWLVEKAQKTPVFSDASGLIAKRETRSQRVAGADRQPGRGTGCGTGVSQRAVRDRGAHRAKQRSM